MTDERQSTYAERVGMQVRDLINTHGVLMDSKADMAARKVRHALSNYMTQVDENLGVIDGGRMGTGRNGSGTTGNDPQIDIETQIAQEEAEATDGE